MRVAQLAIPGVTVQLQLGQVAHEPVAGLSARQGIAGDAFELIFVEGDVIIVLEEQAGCGLLVMNERTVLVVSIQGETCMEAGQGEVIG
ncbi:hypothetical protein DMC61_21485 [Amycolatopsis sp. WAC 04169]|nr:hypothetical protein DMC61_21485 [Amycolatopsis sp. WAC 04169]